MVDNESFDRVNNPVGESQPDHAFMETDGDWQDTEIEALIAGAQKTSLGPDRTIIDSDRIKLLRNEDFIRKIANRLDQDDNPVPKVIGQLELLESLGKGGMGQVFRARHLKLNKIQAVKVLLDHRLGNDEAVSRFDREIRTIGQLNHPNIVAAHDAGTHDGVPYLLMDFVDGKSLQTIVREYKSMDKLLPIGVVANIASQTALAMQYAHQQGIIHRDIKPGNLMIDRKGMVQILDLGLARVTELPDRSIDLEYRELTRDGQVVGTPDFMPPEQLQDSRNVDERADVYSLGATLFTLLTGRVPFPVVGNNIVFKISAILNEPIPSARILRPDVPEPLDRIVSRCLAKSPDQRFQSMTELANALEPWSAVDLAEELGHVKPVKPKPVRAESVKHSRTKSPKAFRGLPPNRRWLIAAGAAAVFLILASILIRLTFPDGGELVIRSDDANVRVSVRKIDGRDSKEFELLAGQPDKSQLSVGMWEITILGAGASEYRLSEDRFEIVSGEQITVTVTRVGPGENAIAASDSARNRVEAESNEIQPAFPIEAGPLESIAPGLIAQPAAMPFRWQTQLIRQLGVSSYDNLGAFDFDPQGKLVAWTNGNDVVVVDSVSERVAHFFPVPRTPDIPDRFWRAVKFSPVGDQIALCSSHNGDIQIRSRDGFLQKALPGVLGYHIGVQWLPDGHHLLQWSSQLIRIVDLEGTVKHELNLSRTEFQELPVHPKPMVLAVHPNDGSVLVGASGERLRRWDPVTDEFEFFSEYEFPAAPCFVYEHLSWSPDGESLIAIQGESSTLFRRDGRQLAKVDEMIAFASWSPNSRFLVGGNLKIYRADNLEFVRQLELEKGDPCLHASWGPPVFAPFWNESDEIVFLSKIREIGSATGLIGEIRRFHPSGNSLPAPRWPQPIVPATAAFVGDGKIATIYEGSSINNSLMIRDQVGKRLMSKVLSRDENHTGSRDLAWDPATENVFVTARYRENQVFDVEGNLKLELTGPLRFPAWSPLDSFLALVEVAPGNDQSRMIVYDNQGKVVYSSPGFSNGLGSIIDWSPDGRWIAWRTFEVEGERSTLNIVDFRSVEKSIHQQVVNEKSSQFEFRFSPDSQWLALEYRPTINSSVASLMRMSDFKVFSKTSEISVESDLCNLTWTNDSKNLLMGKIYSASLDKGLEVEGELSSTQWRSIFRFVDDQNQVLVQLKNNHAAIKALDNTTSHEFPVSGTITIGNHQSYPQLSGHGNQVLVLRRGEYNKNSSVGIINTETGRVEWLALAYDDQESLAFGSAGNVIQGPAEIDRYVIHTVHYPGGRVIPVTRKELDERSNMTEDQLALIWASEVGARLFADGVPIKFDPKSPESFPAIDSIDSIDCSNLIEIADGDLIHLSRFLGLEHLNLSNCPVTTFPKLDGLRSLVLANSSVSKLPELTNHSKLEAIDLTGTKLENIDSLKDCTQLKHLDLSRTLIQASAGLTLAGITSLEKLYLNETAIDSFGLLELSRLSNLQELGLSGANLSEADLDEIQKSLPNCKIVR